MAWAEVWQAALREASVVLALRVALDDAHAHVAAAAAEALAALVALRDAHATALAAADACALGGALFVASLHHLRPPPEVMGSSCPGPGLCWSGQQGLPRVTEDRSEAGAPALPLRQLQRPHAHGAWVANATAPPAHDAADPAAVRSGEGAEGASEERVAVEDPLCGLLQMRARCTPLATLLTVMGIETCTGGGEVRIMQGCFKKKGAAAAHRLPREVLSAGYCPVGLRDQW